MQLPYSFASQRFGWRSGPAQPTHQPELPRRYRTGISCGAFGLGGSRSGHIEVLRAEHAQCA